VVVSAPAPIDLTQQGSIWKSVFGPLPQGAVPPFTWTAEQFADWSPYPSSVWRAIAIGEAPPAVESPYPGPAGKSRGRPPKQRRYELPNGMHVFGTANEVLALAQSLVDEPVVLRRAKPTYKVSVQLADGTKAQAKAVFPVERAALREGDAQSQDLLVETTQSAPDNNIYLDAVVALIEQRALRRRKIAMLLLMV
jgi:hypothetical protein